MNYEMDDHDQEIRSNRVRLGIAELMILIGEDPKRDGLKETPSRVLSALVQMTEGYRQNPNDLFKTFDNAHYGGMVVVRDIEFYSLCEHHLLPFCGVAHVGYLPGGGKIVGLSKIARLVDVFARRLQVQERLTTEITHAIVRGLDPCAGAACVIEAQHLCMACRGVKKQAARMVTSSLIGEFEKPEVRAEFLQLAGL